MNTVTRQGMFTSSTDGEMVVNFSEDGFLPPLCKFFEDRLEVGSSPKLAARWCRPRNPDLPRPQPEIASPRLASPSLALPCLNAAANCKSYVNSATL